MIAIGDKKRSLSEAEWAKLFLLYRETKKETEKYNPVHVLKDLFDREFKEVDRDELMKRLDILMNIGKAQVSLLEQCIHLDKVKQISSKFTMIKSRDASFLFNYCNMASRGHSEPLFIIDSAFRLVRELMTALIWPHDHKIWKKVRKGLAENGWTDFEGCKDCSDIEELKELVAMNPFAIQLMPASMCNDSDKYNELINIMLNAIPGSNASQDDIITLVEAYVLRDGACDNWKSKESGIHYEKDDDGYVIFSLPKYSYASDGQDKAIIDPVKITLKNEVIEKLKQYFSNPSLLDEVGALDRRVTEETDKEVIQPKDNLKEVSHPVQDVPVVTHDSHPTKQNPANSHNDEKKSVTAPGVDDKKDNSKEISDPNQDVPAATHESQPPKQNSTNNRNKPHKKGAESNKYATCFYRDFIGNILSCSNILFAPSTQSRIISTRATKSADTENYTKSVKQPFLG